MAKEVQRVKLSWWERLYIPTFLNGFKAHSAFFSFKKSKVYEEKNKDNKFDHAELSGGALDRT